MASFCSVVSRFTVVYGIRCFQGFISRYVFFFFFAFFFFSHEKGRADVYSSFPYTHTKLKKRPWQHPLSSGSLPSVKSPSSLGVSTLDGPLRPRPSTTATRSRCTRGVPKRSILPTPILRRRNSSSAFVKVSSSWPYAMGFPWCPCTSLGRSMRTTGWNIRRGLRIGS